MIITTNSQIEQQHKLQLKINSSALLCMRSPARRAPWRAGFCLLDQSQEEHGSDSLHSLHILPATSLRGVAGINKSKKCKPSPYSLHKEVHACQPYQKLIVGRKHHIQHSLHTRVPTANKTNLYNTNLECKNKNTNRASHAYSAYSITHSCTLGTLHGLRSKHSSVLLACSAASSRTHSSPASHTPWILGHTAPRATQSIVDQSSPWLATLKGQHVRAALHCKAASASLVLVAHAYYA